MKMKEIKKLREHQPYKRQTRPLVYSSGMNSTSLHVCIRMFIRAFSFKDFFKIVRFVFWAYKSPNVQISIQNSIK